VAAARRDPGRRTSGQAKMSEAAISEAISRRSPADRLSYEGLTYHRQRDYPQAEALYRESLSLDPRHLDSLCLLGTLLSETKRPLEAIEILQGAVAIDTESALAHNNLGIALKAVDRFDEALSSFDKAIALKPRLAKLHFNRGNTLMELERFADALSSFDEAVGLTPDHAETHNNRGSAQRELEQFDAAVASYSKAIALKPDYADAYNNRAIALTQQALLGEALADSEKALALVPDFAAAHCTRGNTLRELGLFDEALASFERAIALKPDWAEPYFAKGTLHLAHGRLTEGWVLYESRFRMARSKKPPSSQPRWDGSTDPSGKHILVLCEQGIGDTFHFVRYLPHLSARGAAVTLWVYDTLVQFMKQLEPNIRVVSNKIKAREIEHDYHCPLLSLPMAMGTTLNTIPDEVPYLRADEGRRLLWKEKLGPADFKVGICWDGRSDKTRSFPVAMFEPISRIPGVRLISLHKGSGEEQLRELPSGMKIETLGDTFDPPGESFLDTAAVMMNCDLVITCDTSVAHLAGALGLPVWVVLKWQAEWRWLFERSDSPWYPTMRLFRQTSRGDWAGPFREVEGELRKIVG
jgi:tetratricopeptide (TPR) repeat protein